MGERRRVTRIPFDGEAHLRHRQRTLPVQLEDLSVHGARLQCRDADTLDSDAPLTLVLTLDDSDITLTLPARLVRRDGTALGLAFQGLDVDDMQHLRRLVMLHGGEEDDDPAALILPDSES